MAGDGAESVRVEINLGAGELNRQHFGFQRAFFDHYYPAPAVEAIQPPADFAERADRFVGAYKWTMSSYTTLEKFSALTGPTINVSNPGDGALLGTVLAGALPKPSRKWLGTISLSVISLMGVGLAVIGVAPTISIVCE